MDIGYEQQSGLGSYFQKSLFSDIDSLKLYAGIHEIHLGKYRLLSRIFPYAIYYIIKENTILSKCQITIVSLCR